MQETLLRQESRMKVFANLWMYRGCPEKMKISVKSTGETILLIDGLPVTDNAEKSPLMMRFSKAQKGELISIQPVTDNRVCLACKNAFYSKRDDAKYCSPRCRQKAKREESERQSIIERRIMLA